jgi:hypothetical protein
MLITDSGTFQTQVQKPLQKHGGRLEHNETYCGSCFGAESVSSAFHLLCTVGSNVLLIRGVENMLYGYSLLRSAVSSLDHENRLEGSKFSLG